MTHHQNGNAVVFVLLGIVLFGLLSYTLINSAKTGQGNLSKHQATLAAQEIADYGTLVARSVGRLRSKNCSENELSFENPIVSGYTNPSTPPDGACKVFDPVGGNITYLQPKELWLDSSKKPLITNGFGNWFIGANLQVDLLGESCPPNGECVDLIMLLPFVKKEICDSINSTLGLNTAYTPENVSYTTYNLYKFMGVFDEVNEGEFGNSDLSLQGKYYGCFFRSWNTHYVFWHVLLVR